MPPETAAAARADSRGEFAAAWLCRYAGRAEALPEPDEDEDEDEVGLMAALVCWPVAEKPPTVEPAVTRVAGREVLPAVVAALRGVVLALAKAEDEALVGVTPPAVLTTMLALVGTRKLAVL